MKKHGLDPEDCLLFSKTRISRGRDAFPISETDLDKMSEFKHVVFNNLPSEADDGVTFYLLQDNTDYEYKEEFGFDKSPCYLFNRASMKKLFTVRKEDKIDDLWEQSYSRYKGYTRPSSRVA